MLENKSNPKEEESLKDEESNQEEEELENTSDELDETEEETDSKESILEKINKGASKKFKDADQVIEALKQQDKKFIEKGTKKEPKKEIKPHGVEERLLVLENPDSEYVLDEILEDSKRLGKEVTELWGTSPYYRNKAQSLAEEARKKEDAEDRIGEPNSNRPTGKGINLSQEDKKLMTDLGVTAEEVAKTRERRINH